MKLLAINCNQCGAPLDVPEKANFLTCAFCPVRLAVKGTESAACIEVRQGFITLGRDGVQRIPSGFGSLVGSLFGVAGGLIFVGALLRIQAPPFMMVFGVMFIVIAFSQGLVSGK